MSNGIVILNYLNSVVTKDTVDLLLKQKNIENFLIVIVDNGSNNGSVELFENSFGYISQVVILSLSDNLGYAKGNDVGIRYLRQQNIDNILIMNSDISFSDNSGLSSLFHSIPTGVGVVGPNIIGENGYPSNPIYLSVDFKSTLIRFIYNLVGDFFPKKIKTKVKSKTDITFKSALLESKFSRLNDDFFLHGAAFVLTSSYFEVIPELYPKTFLYYEAQILKILSTKFHLKYYFNASVLMKHLEDQSSALSYGNKANIKQKMVAKSQFKALLLYFKLHYPQKFIKKWKQDIENHTF